MRNILLRVSSTCLIELINCTYVHSLLWSVFEYSPDDLSIIHRNRKWKKIITYSMHFRNNKDNTISARQQDRIRKQVHKKTIDTICLVLT